MQNRNAYVSQKEVPFPAGTVLISKTDPKGFITYCNEEFEQISGYSHEELMGANHNIVRHPDMPPQAFKWMWHRLLDGKPWRGTVKNRSKNGDHYWVRATVSPIFEDGRITGYVSMRRAPSRQQIQEAEASYRSHTQTGAEYFSPSEHLQFKNWSLRYKLQLVIQSALMVVLGLGQWFISQRLHTDPTTEMELIGGQIALHAFLYYFIGYIAWCILCRNHLIKRRTKLGLSCKVISIAKWISASVMKWVKCVKRSPICKPTYA
ncbi:MAG: PAS domain-containing protein [Sideroxydans sp.]|nr:PAS domain-containing protein [Sideroxydans sp.]